MKIIKNINILMENLDLFVLNLREVKWNENKYKTIEKMYKKYLENNSINLNIDKNIIINNDNKNTFDLLYNINKSITQSYRNTTGKIFEKCIEEVFIKCNIKYSKQVCIDENGLVVDFKKKFHLLDFIIPEIKKDENVNNNKFKIISVKTTLRERYLQDFFLKNIITITLDDCKKENIKVIKIDKIQKNLTKFIQLLI